MTIECEVLLGEIDVNEWLKEHGMRPAHAKLSDDTPIIERCEIKAALLGEHADGIANVILILPATANTANRPVRVSLALLENICEAMRVQVGPDARLIDTDPPAKED
jgi:hypothetical protein